MLLLVLFFWACFKAFFNVFFGGFEAPFKMSYYGTCAYGAAFLPQQYFHKEGGSTSTDTMMGGPDTGKSTILMLFFTGLGVVELDLISILST